MTHHLRVGLSALAAAALIILSGGSLAQAATLGFAGISDYSSGPVPYQCMHGNRAGAQFVIGCDNNLSGTTGFFKTDTFVLDQDLKSTTQGPNFTNFFLYSGHGHSSGWSNQYGTMQGGAALHLYSTAANMPYHGITTEASDAVNTCWDELRLGHHGTTDSLRWFAAYTCNFLTYDGTQYQRDRMGAMFEGLHLALGFAGQMYLDSSGGASLGSYLNNGATLRAAWDTMCYTTQLNHSAVTCRVFGHWHTIGDSFPSFNTENLSYYMSLNVATRNSVYLFYDYPVGG